MTHYNPILDKQFTPPMVEGKYYNLATGRAITKTATNLKKYVFREDPPVAGTVAEVARFEGKEAAVEQKIAGGESKEGKEEIKAEGPPAWVPTSTDVADIPAEQLLNLCDFNYRGLRVKARMVRIIDGDTFDLVFYLPAEFIAMERKLSSRSPPQRNGILFPETKGYFMLLNARFFGVDAFEHDTEPGRAAIKLLEAKCDQVDNILYITMLKYEKFGRLLVEVYLDSEWKMSLNNYMVNYTHPILGKLAYPYDGGAKSDFARMLTRTSKPKGMSRDEYNLPTKKATLDKPGLGACEIKEVVAAAVMGAETVVADLERAEDREISLLEEDTVRYAPEAAPTVDFISKH